MSTNTDVIPATVVVHKNCSTRSHWSMWLAWIFPLTGYALGALWFFRTAAWAIDVYTWPSLIGALLLLFLGCVTTIASFCRGSWRHGLAGIAALLLGGPAMLAVSFLGSAENRSKITKAVDNSRREARLRNEPKGPYLLSEVDVSFEPIPVENSAPAKLFAEDQSIRMLMPAEKIKGNPQPFWSPDGQYVYLYFFRQPLFGVTSEELWLIRTDGFVVEQKIRLPDIASLATTSEGLVAIRKPKDQLFLFAYDLVKPKKALQLIEMPGPRNLIGAAKANLVVCHEYGKLRLIDVQSGKQLWLIETPPLEEIITRQLIDEGSKKPKPPPFIAGPNFQASIFTPSGDYLVVGRGCFARKDDGLHWMGLLSEDRQEPSWRRRIDELPEFERTVLDSLKPTATKYMAAEKDRSGEMRLKLHRHSNSQPQRTPMAGTRFMQIKIAPNGQSALARSSDDWCWLEITPD